ncbi:Xylose isomerase-like TIM barrel [Micromonospora pattaloongensis]|uniref:Xylose isomerase-like TIM barrel n=1 Tax=Micromonospora pattaloongensis TaxID=405436 RepID=A0A1H3NJD8_9ACTN|nr:ThuA domain-containing protein [Micromonospora pattaloongensis]SDY88545.1 Xylose isomerase-like TIM barrel [Micromonospora pattaloongensis]
MDRRAVPRITNRWAPVARVAAALLAVPLLSVASSPAQAQAAQPRFTVLVFSKVTNVAHDSIPAGVAAIKQLGRQHNFAVTATTDAHVFTDKRLRPYDAVIFNNTNSTPEKGNLLNAEQRAAFQRFIQGGGGFAGLHSATASERDWGWYAGLVGATFDNHPTPRAGRIEVLDRVHPSTRGLPQLWERTEEWYNWQAAPNGNVHVLTELRTTDNPEGLTGGPEHAHSWCQVYDGGRSWYTASGHDGSAFAEPLFRQHLLGGIEWAAGAAGGDCGATEWGNFRKTTLEGDTNLADPFELAPLPDGRVLYVQRTGQIKLIHATQNPPTTTLAGDLRLQLDTKQHSDGLVGLTIDNDFADNGWVYLLYTDPMVPAPEQAHFNLSRFTLVGDTLDMASEKRLLRFPVWRNELRANVHMAGSLTMDDDGNLYAATGDNTDPFVQQGYSPIDERPGQRAADAQATSANTNDLRGKIIRIHPEDDGTYTVPDGNLFTGAEDGGGKTRPEIYAMGFRNPFRIAYDEAADALLVADYGPDATVTNPQRGPAGMVEQNRITRAGNYGWPYCIGPNIPYVDYDFATGQSGEAFNCAAPVNDSPHNTGLRNLPAAQTPLIWYGNARQGWGRDEFPEIPAGGAPMAGAVYEYDATLDSATKFPEYYDGKWFISEYGGNWYKTVSVLERDAPSAAFPPARAGDLLSINSFVPTMGFTAPFDAEFGADGSLYVIDFGSGSGVGRGSHNRGSGIYRIDYVGGPAATTPRDRCMWGYSPASTVSFGAGRAHTDVPNDDLGDGCTIMDVIWHEAPFRNHDLFVEAVGEVTRELRDAGTITPEERSQIMSAANRSEIGNTAPVTRNRTVPNNHIGLVLYTVRATMPAAPEATLAALSDCGFRNAEPSGSVNNYYGKSATDLAPRVAGAGMSVPSTGVSQSNLENNLDGVIADAKAFGARYVRISGSGSWRPADYAKLARTLNSVGAKLKQAGITVAYHNHGFEFTEQNGVRGYDVLLRETDPRLVAMELDLYWAASAGVDPVDLIKRYPGRFSLFHVKDMAADGSFADVGEGTINFSRIFAHSEMAGVDYYFTENDSPKPDGVSSACDSYSNLRKIRY